MAQLKVGDKAPDFSAQTDNGEKLKLSDLRGQKVVLYFYPKDNTKGCTVQACHLRDHYPLIQEKNAVVVGISPDGVKSHQNFKSKNDLPFPLVVDSDHSIAAKYGAWGEKSMYGRKYMGIIRSQFIIDEKGKIIDLVYKVSPKKSADAAVKALN